MKKICAPAAIALILTTALSVVRAERSSMPVELAKVALDVTLPADARAPRRLSIYTETGGVERLEVVRRLYRDGELEEITSPLPIPTDRVEKGLASTMLASIDLEAPNFVVDGLYVERIEAQVRSTRTGAAHRSRHVLFFSVQNGAVSVLTRQEYSDLSTIYTAGVDRNGRPETTAEAVAIPTTEVVERGRAERVE